MKRDFDIVGAIELVQGRHRLDLHNDFDFVSLEYRVSEQELRLLWIHPHSETLAAGRPEAVMIEFTGVRLFQVLPRDAEITPSEDACIDAIGLWGKLQGEDATVVLIESARQLDLPMAFRFRSGTTIIVEATKATALITLR